MAILSPMIQIILAPYVKMEFTKMKTPYNFDFKTELPFIIAGAGAMTYGLLMTATEKHFAI